MNKIKKSLFFISYEEAQLICDKVQYGEASSFEKLKLNVRLLWCKMTQNYTSKNVKLTSICQAANLNSMDNDKKDELKRLLGGQIEKTKDSK